MSPAKLVPAARAGPGPTMVAPKESTADNSNNVMDGDGTPPPLPSAGDRELLQAANTFLYTASGFYSPAREDFYADDFVFRAPVIGPLCKRDYLDTMGKLGIYNGIPNLSPNAFGFTVDPENPLRVWFFVRMAGTNTGPLGAGFGQSFPPSGNEIRGLVETYSITFNEARKVKLLTAGYVADRFDEQANTGGAGAVLGVQKAAGNLPASFSITNPVFQLVQRIGNSIAPKGWPVTVSKPENVPAWWPFEERGTEGA